MNNLDIANELREYAYCESMRLGGRATYTDEEAIAVSHAAVVTGASIAIKAVPEGTDVKPVLELLVTNYTIAAEAEEMPPLSRAVALGIKEYLADILGELAELEKLEQDLAETEEGK